MLERYDDYVVECVRKSSKSKYIYGCGNIGISLLDYLTSKNIFIDGFIVDDAYYKTNCKEKIKIYKISDIADEDADIFIGFANIVEAEKRIRAYGISSTIYCISNPYRYLDSHDITINYYQAHEMQFEKAKSLFEDKLSKDIFDAYLKTRIYKDYRYLLPYSGCKSYFNEELICLGRQEVFVDCGAYDGDSINAFLQAVSNQYKRIIAIEPDPRNFEKLRENETRVNIDLFNLGVWNKKERLFFNGSESQESSISDDVSDNYIDVDKLDNLVGEENVTLIKMSVQGAERNALLGASRILTTMQPRLAITIFMKEDALFEIPKTIKDINPKYKLYLRCEEPFFARVILYAVAQEA